MLLVAPSIFLAIALVFIALGVLATISGRQNEKAVVACLIALVCLLISCIWTVSVASQVTSNIKERYGVELGFEKAFKVSLMRDHGSKNVPVCIENGKLSLKDTIANALRADSSKNKESNSQRNLEKNIENENIDAEAEAKVAQMASSGIGVSVEAIRNATSDQTQLEEESGDATTDADNASEQNDKTATEDAEASTDSSDETVEQNNATSGAPRNVEYWVLYVGDGKGEIKLDDFVLLAASGYDSNDVKQLVFLDENDLQKATDAGLIGAKVLHENEGAGFSEEVIVTDGLLVLPKLGS